MHLELVTRLTCEPLLDLDPRPGGAGTIPAVGVEFAMPWFDVEQRLEFATTLVS